MIEKHIHEESGYHPFLIREGWQVAQLNYLPGHGLDDIDDVECHHQTDEVFILLNGTGVLVAAVRRGDDFELQYEKMEVGITYNIPAGVWHNIAMSDDARMIIVEKDHTHLNDCEHCRLSEELLDKAHRRIMALAHSDKER